MFIVSGPLHLERHSKGLKTARGFNSTIEFIQNKVLTFLSNRNLLQAKLKKKMIKAESIKSTEIERLCELIIM